MKVIDKHSITRRFAAEDGEYLDVQYDNRGDPYRQGIALSFRTGEGEGGAAIFLDEREAKQLRKLIEDLFPEKAKP